MNTVPDWKVPKWPFLSAYALLVAVAGIVIYKTDHPMSPMAVAEWVGCVVLGTWLGCLPYWLEYRATCKLVDVNAVGTVAEKLQDLQKYAAEISAATGQWALVQEATKGHSDKTVAAAREIAEKMADEIREFSEFQGRLNDTEKAALRLEVDKLRRNEGEWIQVLARILDHIFALHNAAARAGNAELSDQIGNFQHACREAARRVGLAPFDAAPADKFDAHRHRAHGVENPPADAVVAETLAPGLNYQGRLLRPALVRLQDASATAAEAPEPAAPPAAEPAPPDQLALEADE